MIDNNIMNSVFETAAALPTIEGLAAINQLLIEASSPFEGVVPAGFSLHETIVRGKAHQTYYLHTKLSEPFPLEDKVFCGSGDTPELAFYNLVKQTSEWFAPTDAFLSENETADLRTEYAA